MSEWITERLPQANRMVLITINNVVLLGLGQDVITGQPWMYAPEPYVEPIRVRRTGMLSYSQGAPAIPGLESFTDDPDFDMLLRALDERDQAYPTPQEWQFIISIRNGNK